MNNDKTGYGHVRLVTVLLSHQYIKLLFAGIASLNPFSVPPAYKPGNPTWSPGSFFDPGRRNVGSRERLDDRSTFEEQEMHEVYEESEDGMVVEDTEEEDIEDYETEEGDFEENEFEEISDDEAEDSNNSAEFIHAGERDQNEHNELTVSQFVTPNFDHRANYLCRLAHLTFSMIFRCLLRCLCIPVFLTFLHSSTSLASQAQALQVRWLTTYDYCHTHVPISI